MSVSSSVDHLAEPLRTEVKRLVALDSRIRLGSGRRTEEEQYRAGISNGCGTDTSRWPGSCRVATAPPGRSKHQLGLAADLEDGTRGRTIVAQVVREHGLPIKRTVPSESWHYEHNDTAGRSIDDLIAAGYSSTGSGPSSPGQGSAPATGAGSTGGGGGLIASLSLLSDPSTWLRVAHVLGGLVLLAAGLALVGLDLGGLV